MKEEIRSEQLRDALMSERDMPPSERSEQQKSEVEKRITDYLVSGGLFNPEMANHDRVRDLLVDCRAALTDERQRREQGDSGPSDTTIREHRKDKSLAEQAQIIAGLHQQLLSALAAIEKLLRDDGHYIECPAPNQETHDFMPNSKDVQRCKALQSVDLSPLHEHVRKEQKPLVDTLEWAWTIIANAGGGDWQRESKEWQDAAAKWRDEAYHPALAKMKE